MTANEIKELFESGAMLITDNRGNTQMLMNEGTFVEIANKIIRQQCHCVDACSCGAIQ